MKKRLFVFACVVMTSVYLCGCDFSAALKDAFTGLAEAFPEGSEIIVETLADAGATGSDETGKESADDNPESASEGASEDGAAEDGSGDKNSKGDAKDGTDNGSDDGKETSDDGSKEETPEQKAERIRRENQEKERQERLEKEKAEEEEAKKKEEEEKAKKAEEEKKAKEEAERKRQEEEKKAEEERRKQIEEEKRAAEEQQQNTIADLEANAGARMIELINAKRAEAGLGALTLDPTLCSLAKVRADEIVSKFDHTRPDGRSCFTVFDDAGVGYMAAGENIAAGYPSVEAAFDAWMNSEGHRANLMNPAFGKIGIGFTYSDGGYRYYWTQVFTD